MLSSLRATVPVAVGVCTMWAALAAATPPPAPTSTPTPLGKPATLVVAGDIAACDGQGDEATARLVDDIVRVHADAAVGTLGDNVYEAGSTEEFARCYQPSWGRFLSRTRPAVGNHEYRTKDAAPYYRYFGPRAGPRGKGYYSYELGAWHVVVLNSNCDVVGGCARGSPQADWLAADLKAHAARCTVAMWHHPLFSSGAHGANAQMHDLWSILDENGADLVLTGHDHHYERFAALHADGTAGGMRSFVVGTGGRSHYPTLVTSRGSEKRESDAFGVLELTLEDTGYRWRFHAVSPSTFTDDGADRCR